MSSPTAANRPDVWTQAWHAVGHRVAGLLEHHEPVTPDTLPLAVASHAATVRLLVTVHRDLTHRGMNKQKGDDDRLTLRQLEANPVQALGAALERHPATPGVALSDVLTTNPPPGPTRLWHDLARAATVAHQHWATAAPESRPRHHQAWSVMADVAAIGQGLAVLDTDISSAATRMPPTIQTQLNTAPGVLSDRYAGAATQGLRAAGERTRHLAEQGPLPDVAPLRQPRTRPEAVRAPVHVPLAQEAVVELLARADAIAPRDLVLLVRAQVTLSEHAARLTRSPDLANTARRHAAVLAGISTRQLATIEPSSDQRPIDQTRALLNYVAKIPPTHPDAERIAAAIARSQPDMIGALHRTGRHQLATGAWLVPNPNERATTSIWTRQTSQPGAPPGTPPAVQPDLMNRLVDARPHAHDLAQTAGVNPFPDTAAAVALATARQGLPPRYAVHPPAFPRATQRPAAPSRAPRSTDLER